LRKLRTPEKRFENLPDYDFAANYVDVDELRMHYVDEGPSDGEVVLLLHGEPSWSYLYRYMIPPLAEAGLRVIAPDLIGFGKSDKPTKKSDYSYAGHVAWMRQFVETLDLNGITLFCQDWGSLIGLRVAAENEFQDMAGIRALQPVVPHRQDHPESDDHGTVRRNRCSVRRALSFLKIQDRGTRFSNAGPDHTGRSRQRCQPGSMEDFCRMAEALSYDVQQPGSGHTRR
jgi:hypothetical protein